MKRKPVSTRLRAVSVFLENPCGRMQNKLGYNDCERDVRVAMRCDARSIDGRTSRGQSCLKTYLFRVLPYGFSRKRETARSLATTKNPSFPKFISILQDISCDCN